MLIKECNRSFLYILCAHCDKDLRCLSVISQHVIKIGWESYCFENIEYILNIEIWATRVTWHFKNEIHCPHRFMRYVICVHCIFKVLTILAYRHTFKTGQERFQLIFLDGQGRSDIIGGLGGYHACTSFVSVSFTPSSHIVLRTGWSLPDEFTQL